MPTPPNVSVIICTLNREEVLRQSIQDVWDQGFAGTELVVVDQTDALSKDMEAFYAANAGRLKLVRMETKGLGQARNRGLKEASAGIVLYIDDDVRLQPDLIANHLRHFSDPQVGAVVGRVDDDKGDPPSLGGRVNWYGKVTVEREVAAEHEVESLSGGNMSIRAGLLKDIGGFWELSGNLVQLREETDTALRIRRAGFKVLGDPRAGLLHLAVRGGGTRTSVDRIAWYQDLFFAEYAYFFRNFPLWKLPFYMWSLTRPALACALYYGKGRPRAFAAPWKGLVRAWRLTRS